MRIITVVALALMASACASITRGTTEQLQINSNPPQAQARTSMGFVCVTPCTLQTNRKDEFTVTISKAGFHTTEIPIISHIGSGGAAGFAGNVLVGGVIGMAADAATGATLEHFPNPVTVTLVPLKKGEQPTVIKIVPQPPKPKPEEIDPNT